MNVVPIEEVPENIDSEEVELEYARKQHALNQREWTGIWHRTRKTIEVIGLFLSAENALPQDRSLRRKAAINHLKILVDRCWNYRHPSSSNADRWPLDPHRVFRAAWDGYYLIEDGMNDEALTEIMEFAFAELQKILCPVLRPDEE